MFQEKLGLFAFLAGSPIRRLYRCPINFLQLCKIFAILKIIRPGIRERKDSAPAVFVRPDYHGMQIGLQMDNRALPAPIVQLKMIGLMDQVKHDGAWAEIERHTVANAQIRITI